MQAQPHHNHAARIVALLHDAAAQVVRDPDATRTRLAEATTLLGVLQGGLPCLNGPARALAPWQAQRVRAYIDAHLDTPIRIEALAAHIRLSVSYFFRAFRGSFGEAPHAFVMRCRTDRAMQLLARDDEPIAGIAAACGFADQAHFSRVFARRAGMPPGAWRRSQRDAAFAAAGSATGRSA